MASVFETYSLIGCPFMCLPFSSVLHVNKLENTVPGMESTNFANWWDSSISPFMRLIPSPPFSLPAELQSLPIWLRFCIPLLLGRIKMQMVTDSLFLIFHLGDWIDSVGWSLLQAFQMRRHQNWMYDNTMLMNIIGTQIKTWTHHM